MSGGRFVPRYKFLSTCIAAAFGAASAPSLAQQTGIEEITITGTRIARDADYQTPNPTTTVDGEYLRSLGIVNVGSALMQNPTNVTRFSMQTTGSGSFFVGTQMANLRGLNPYFGTRTLTLVDSRRHVPTNQGGSVDLNFVPSVIVERMETVTGGASASYGSDAVTGVVNILLDKDMTGLRLETDYGVTGEGDGDNFHLGIGGGRSLFDGRGHVVVGYEHEKQDAIYNCAAARDWCAEGLNTFQNSATAPITRETFPELTGPRPFPGQPHLLILGDQRSGTHPNGLISDRRAGATRYRFNDEGTSLVPYDAGQFAQINANRNVIGGEGRPIYDMQTLMPEVERNVLYTHFNYDLSDRLQFYTDLSYGKVDTRNQQAGPATNVICIRPDNAFIPTLDAESQAILLGAIGQQVGAAGACGQSGGEGSGVPWSPGAVITKDFRPQQNQGIHTSSEVSRLVAGFRGDIGTAGRWTWDAYYQYGHATRDQIADDYITTYRFALAADAVINPLTGQPDCRVNVAAPGTQHLVYPTAFMDPFLVQGCAPLNPFGKAMSDAAHDYAFDPLEEFNTIDQQVFAGSVSGELWQGWGAGPLLAAAGLEYRLEDMENDTYKDRPRAHSLDTSVSFGTDWAGESTVTEGFVEFEMPLISDKPLARQWTLNVAGRRTRYENTELERTNGGLSSTHSVTSWKVQSIWEPVEWFRLRGSRSRDIRAAGFRELYYQQLLQKGATNGRVTNPFTPGGPTPDDFAEVILTGNPALTPEKADTDTFGVVFSPGGFAEGLRLSVDYYSIKLKDGIIRGASGRIVENCAQEYAATASLTGEFCSLIGFLPDSNGAPILTDIEQVLAPYYNDQPYEARGIDYAAQYTLGLKSGGTLNLRLMASHALEQTIVVGTNRAERDLSGMLGGGGFLPDYTPAADWSANLIVGYNKGPFTVTTQASYTSSGWIDTVTPWIGPDDPRYNPLNVNSIIDNTIPSHITQNLNLSYDFAMRDTEAQVWMSINNLWDKEPPFATGATGGRNGAYHDILGRSFRVGLRLTF